MTASSRPELVREPAALRALAQRLARATRVALDTESASFHRYVDRVYLLQVSTDRETALIDPTAVKALDPVGAILADPHIEVIFHDADYDLRTLDRDYGFRARTLFDTRIAAQLAGEPSVGLGSLLTKYFDVRLNKKFQRADWSQRPLTAEMIAYAADDTRYLLPLRDRLAAQLVEQGRLGWAEEEFRQLEQVRWSQQPADREHAFLRIKGAKALRGRALAILRALHEWREGTAQRRDRAPFRIIGNASLVNIARAAPTTPTALAAVANVPQAIARRYGTELLDAVQLGLAVPERDLPRVRRDRRPRPDADYVGRLERLKQLRAARAASVGMDVGLLCPNGTLQEVARVVPRTADELDRVGELRRWQREVLGDQAILAAVKG